jgi:hypothetical protein
MTNFDLLQEAINAKNMAYSERNKMLVAVCRMAIALGCNAGLGKHVGNWEEDWRNIVFIDLPSGQVSWHLHDCELNLFSFLPTYNGTWDGHSTQEKWDRVLNAFSDT